jgi:hypothetical protein
LQLACLPSAATGEANKIIGLRFLMLAQAEKTCQGKTSAGNGLHEITPDVGESGKFGRATTRRRGSMPSVRDSDL